MFGLRNILFSLIVTKEPPYFHFISFFKICLNCSSLFPIKSMTIGNRVKIRWHVLFFICNNSNRFLRPIMSSKSGLYNKLLKEKDTI